MPPSEKYLAKMDSLEVMGTIDYKEMNRLQGFHNAAMFCNEYSTKLAPKLFIAERTVKGIVITRIR